MASLYAYQVALFFIVLVIAQSAWIGLAPGRTWEASAFRYRGHQWIAFVISVFTCLILFGVCIGGPAVPVPPVNQATGFRGQSIFTVFLLGLVRSILDTKLPVVGRSKGLWDAFFFGAILSLVFDWFTPSEEGLAAIFMQPICTLTGFLVVVLSGGIYMAWIYSLLVRRMTLIDRFSGPVVNRFLLKTFYFEVPLQIVLIGPKRAGKSMITAAICNLNHADFTDSTVPKMGTFLTQLSRRAATATQPGQRPTRVIGALIDTPGENMGQHLAAAINSRTDSLALVISAHVLDANAIGRPEGFGSIEEFCEAGIRNSVMFSGKDVAQATKQYLTNLETATRGSNLAVAGMEELSQLYNVHSFALIIYGPLRVEPGSPAEANLRALAKGMGRMFGVPEARCVHLLLEDGNAALGGFANTVLPAALR